VEGFPYVYSENVRFRDLDPMGHVNNAVYLTYMEQARILFLADRGASTDSIIVARVEIDYRAPLRLGDTVEVGVRTGRLGTKSFDLEYELRAAGRTVAEARSVNVFYDYEQRTPAELPAEWKERLAAVAA
jgi:acyl-CoA thioester hydrolase